MSLVKLICWFEYDRWFRETGYCEVCPICYSTLRVAVDYDCYGQNVPVLAPTSPASAGTISAYHCRAPEDINSPRLGLPVICRADWAITPVFPFFGDILCTNIGRSSSWFLHVSCVHGDVNLVVVCRNRRKGLEFPSALQNRCF